MGKSRRRDDKANHSMILVKRYRPAEVIRWARWVDGRNKGAVCRAFRSEGCSNRAGGSVVAIFVRLSPGGDADRGPR